MLNRAVTIYGCLWTYTAYGKVANSAVVTKIPNVYTITASAGANGSINPSGAVQVTEGNNQTFTITANSGYVVDTVTVDGVSQGPLSPYTFVNVTANHTISATFKTDPDSGHLAYWKFNETSGTMATDWTGHGHSGTTNAGCSWVAGEISNALSFNGTSGSMSVPSMGTGIAAFTVAGWINVTALPAGSGWQAAHICGSDGWYAGCLALLLLGPNSGTHAGQLQLSVDGAPGNDLVWTATNFGNYLNTWMHIAAVYSSTGAKVYVNGVPDGTATFSTGQTADFSSVKVGSWNGSSRYFNGKMDDFHFYSRALSDTDISNLYSWNGTWTITSSAGTGGSITPSGNVAVNDGANQSFTISPNSGYSISQVTVDGVNQGAISSYTFYTVVAAHTISATFVSNNYTITASAGTGGTINPSGAVQVAPGANQTFTIAPNTGYIISSVTVDSVNVGCLRSYTFTNVQANHTIAVAFTANTDLVAYYKFDETSGTTAADCTANAKNGTLYGNCTWATGLTNNALSIPGGTGDYVGLPTGIVSGLTNFTIVAWVKLTSVSTNMRIFDFGTSTTNYMEMTPKHSNSSGKIQFYIRTSSTTKSVTGTAALPTGSWQQVAVTLSSQTLTLYVQGAQVGQITNCTINPNSLGSTTNNYIGKSQTSSHPHLNGLVDGFRIYNRALTGTEITALYNGGAGPASVGGGDDNDWIIIPAR